jgi:hypothetical protein
LKKFASQITAAVASGELQEPFNAAAVKAACPGWADLTYHTFLPLHVEGNGTATELFVRIARGSYRLKNSN